MKPDWGNKIFFSLELSDYKLTNSEISNLLKVNASFSKPSNERRPNRWVLKSEYFLPNSTNEPKRFAEILSRISISGLSKIINSSEVSFYCVIETTDRNYEYEVPPVIIKAISKLGLSLKLDFYIFSKASIKKMKEG